jgi:hypothetical protein
LQRRRLARGSKTARRRLGGELTSSPSDPHPLAPEGASGGSGPPIPVDINRRGKLLLTHKLVRTQA